MTCTCTHELIDHHLTGYKGHRGKEGHGMCSLKGCPCKAFNPVEANDR